MTVAHSAAGTAAARRRGEQRPTTATASSQRELFHSETCNVAAAEITNDKCVGVVQKEQQARC